MLREPHSPQACAQDQTTASSSGRMQALMPSIMHHVKGRDGNVFQCCANKKNLHVPWSIQNHTSSSASWPFSSEENCSCKAAAM